MRSFFIFPFFQETVLFFMEYDRIIIDYPLGPFGMFVPFMGVCPLWVLVPFMGICSME